MRYHCNHFRITNIWQYQRLLRIYSNRNSHSLIHCGKIILCIQIKSQMCDKKDWTFGLQGDASGYRNTKLCFNIHSIWNLCVILVTQSWLILCNPMDYSLPDSSVHGILQARILDWVAIPVSRSICTIKQKSKT